MEAYHDPLQGQTQAAEQQSSEPKSQHSSEMGILMPELHDDAPSVEIDRLASPNDKPNMAESTQTVVVERHHPQPDRRASSSMGVSHPRSIKASKPHGHGLGIALTTRVFSSPNPEGNYTIECG
jgi:hypothetical protein